MFAINTRLIMRLSLFCLLLCGSVLQARASSISRVTATSPVWNFTYINDAYYNGHPERILIVTQNFSGFGVYNNHHIGVWYDSAAGKWAIFNQDRLAMPVNASFNVLGADPSGNVFTHIAGSGSISGHVTYINNPATNGHPEAKVFVTARYNPNNVYNDHATGIWYDAGRSQWAIFNQDFAPMPNGAAFDVIAMPPGAPWIYTHIASAANSAGDYTLLTAVASDTFVFITPNYNPYGVYSNHESGVWYTGSVWSIFNEDFYSVPNLAAFNVWVMPTPG